MAGTVLRVNFSEDVFEELVVVVQTFGYPIDSAAEPLKAPAKGTVVLLRVLVRFIF